jgi:hypothetical protein
VGDGLCLRQQELTLLQHVLHLEAGGLGPVFGRDGLLQVDREIDHALLVVDEIGSPHIDVIGSRGPRMQVVWY